MNSTKYFNFKFLKENFKQAKGLLIFFTSVLPLITIIYFIMKLMGRNYVFSFTEFSLITYLLAFIIPFILAFVLFGFVFKKKSVDFYLAQPVNRKTIFVTNFLGGIGLLFSIIFLTTMVMLIFSLTTNLVLPFGMILDYFIFFFVTYLFMFSMATLAISLSGNLVTSLVVTLLILCLMPFLKVVNRTMTDMKTNTYAYCSSEVCASLSKENNQPLGYNAINALKPIREYNFTTMISYPLIAKYQTRNVIYTLGLTILYSVLGFMAFKKRKMENNECSFKNPRVYYFVKCLTIIPLGFLLFCLICDHEFSTWLMLLFLSFTHFLAYDLITKKRIEKIILNLNLFVLSMVLLHGVYYVWMRVATKDVYLKNIDAIILDYNGYSQVEITDPNYIDKLISYTVGTNYDGFYAITATIKSGHKNYTTVLNVPSEIDTGKENIIMEYIKENNLKTDISKFDYQKIDTITSNDISENIKLQDKDLKQLLNATKDLATDDNINFTYLNLYKYENHELKEIEFPVGKAKELATYVAKLFNHRFMANFAVDDVYFFGVNETYSESFSAMSYIISHYPDSAKKLVNFLKAHQDDEIQDGFYSISMNVKNNYYKYIIGDLKKFDTIYQEILNDHKTDGMVQNLLQDSKNEYDD